MCKSPGNTNGCRDEEKLQGQWKRVEIGERESCKETKVPAREKPVENCMDTSVDKYKQRNTGIYDHNTLHHCYNL